MTAYIAFGLAAASQALTVVAVGFTAPSDLLRPAVATAVLVITWVFNEMIQGKLENRLYVALLSTVMWIQCIKSFDDLCLTGLSFERGIIAEPVERATRQAPNRPKKSSRIQPRGIQGWEFSKRLLFGLGSLWNMRGIGTGAQITQIRPWSEQNSFFVPSRSQELRRHLKNTILSYAVLDGFAHQPSPDHENMMSPKNERLFGRFAEIEPEEAIFRFFATFGFWLNTFCVIQLINSILCILYIALDVYPVQMLPPIWGNVSDAYSIRRFWGNTWHQTIRRPLVSVSEFLVHQLLHIKKGTLLARYSKLMICFYISGFLHFPADLALGIAVQESNAVAFFLTTALAIICEDGVQYLFHRVADNTNSSWPRCFGYLWVCCYMYWMTPSWAYPAARVVQPKDRLVSFSLIEELVSLTTK